MTAAITFRAATLDDIPALGELIPLSMAVIGGQVYSPEELEIVQQLIGVDPQIIEDNTYFVAETEGKIIACGGWSYRKKLYGGAGVAAAPAVLDPKTDPARIRAFFVHPEWAGHRLGTRMLTMCEDAARAAGFKRVELGSTRPGEPFYAKHGYEPLETVLQTAPDGRSLPLLRMGKSL
jgi:N-acetylglutamate synthase-like GNAT family acetyltransferase